MFAACCYGSDGLAACVTIGVKLVEVLNGDAGLAIKMSHPFKLFQYAG